MNKMKELMERQAEILEKIEVENVSEERSIEKIDELFAELDSVKAEIKKEQEIENRLLEVKQGEVKTMEKKMEVRNYNEEIRSALELGKEINISEFEVEGVEERAIGMAQGSKQVANIAKKTFANSILEKATDKHTLFGKIRHEAMTTATHQIPVQKSVIGEFAPVQELANYAKKNADFGVVNMGAFKFGNITQISHEALADTGYDILGQILGQYRDGLEMTLEKLVVKGDSTAGNTVQGLESHTDGDGAAKVTQTQADVADMTDEDVVALIEKLYRALPAKYRHTATFVLPQDIVDALSFAKDANGRLLISYDYSQVPMGGKVQMYLLGCPVVCSPYVTGLRTGRATNKVAFFGDLTKCQIGSLRKQFTLQTSNEAGFLNDSLHIKGSIRCDVKKGLSEALAFVELA